MRYREKMAYKKARVDILNVVEIQMPSKEVRDSLKLPDLHKIINKGLKEFTMD